MSGKRIGERLSGMVPLSGHDIEEILSEQSGSGKRFGDIAMELGLCTPEHIFRAWSSQLAESPQRVDIESFGVDSQAIAHLPYNLAVRFHAMPLRVLENELVVAVDEAAYPEVAKQLLSVLHINIRFVLSSHQQIARAMRSYYAKSNAA